MKYLIVLVSLSLMSCTNAKLVNTRGFANNPHAPINETKGGTMKYENSGSRWRMEAKRNNAYEAMYKTCQGKYKIVREYQETEAFVGTNRPGGLAFSFPENFVYLDFQCEVTQ